jgi:pyruvate/2-oxoacid:ferredoxin oxidoreductase alpha subunit/ferredoxin
MSETLTRAERPKPFLFNQFCKACGRCVEACSRGAITMGTEIDPRTGVTPVVIDLDKCNGCGLCFEACPEPFGLMPKPDKDFDPGVIDPETIFGAKASTAAMPIGTPDEFVGLRHTEPMVLKGTHASAVGALLAGCRHFFGYPITPSTEGAELLAKLLPGLGGTFVQAVSEVAAVNMMYGAGGAGRRTMTFTSSPGFSLMLEGISYMIGAEVPAVFVNIMRGGPGLGNIAPEQADIKLVCRGLGHGNTHGIVLAPASPQEMLDLTMLSFELAFKYRNPVILVGDGYLGQITGKVQLPETMVRPGIPEWAVFGDAPHRGNLINSIRLSETDLEMHNEYLNEKYARMKAEEQRADTFLCDDAEWIVIAANTPARMAKGAVEDLRGHGVKAGLFRPITLWPFPIDRLAELVPHARGFVVVEAGSGQLEDEVRLAMSHAGLALPEMAHVRRSGGVLPSKKEIIDRIQKLEEVSHGHGVL